MLVGACVWPPLPEDFGYREGREEPLSPMGEGQG